ncbi:aldose 1-epimerase family protein [Halanaerobium hydrogeniformans]|uniref:Aldose 1-epimerase n=1 Tax=Halanaerobium hydrogeniformans TaxID=656519 RepID=E4RPB3_HALHG|nr:aldose 1-epimerase family protein [Halanaerobium hydrogeniformans]ADQ13798.1 Aldose 1-epimerase [Halanaerobium hydrogeniformans]
MYKIENEELLVEFELLGAQMRRLKSKVKDKDYLWHGDAKYWKRSAPVLFPIVGRLKNDEYQFEGKKYSLSQHGFARDKDFELRENKEKRILFRLIHSQATLEVYPFKFELYIEYRLKKNRLEIEYRVKNIDDRDIYFSIGAHPAFYWPLDKNLSKEDYILEFEQPENLKRHLLNEKGLLTAESEDFLKDSRKIELNEELFKADALVFKDPKSQSITLKSSLSNDELKLNFESFPYLGIWSKAEGAPFICIEPWYGIADSADSEGDLKNKEGIIRLKSEAEFYCQHSIEIK